MDCYAVERHVDWSKRGEMYTFRFEKHGHTYMWSCVAEARKKCMRLVTDDAHNPGLNLSLVDATYVNERIREVIQPEFGSWVEVEAAPAEDVVELDHSDVRWIGWVFSVSGATLVTLFFLVALCFVPSRRSNR